MLVSTPIRKCFLVDHLENLAPALTGDVRMQAIPFDARIAQPEGLAPLFLRNDLPQALLDECAQRRVPARRDLAGLTKKRIGDFQRCFHCSPYRWVIRYG